jgi:hypothetical protein
MPRRGGPSLTAWFLFHAPSTATTGARPWPPATAPRHRPPLERGIHDQHLFGTPFAPPFAPSEAVRLQGEMLSGAGCRRLWVRTWTRVAHTRDKYCHNGSTAFAHHRQRAGGPRRRSRSPSTVPSKRRICRRKPQGSRDPLPLGTAMASSSSAGRRRRGGGSVSACRRDLGGVHGRVADARKGRDCRRGEHPCRTTRARPRQ